MSNERTSCIIDDDESLEGLFAEIWERESQPELRFDVIGTGTVGCLACVRYGFVRQFSGDLFYERYLTAVLV